MPQTDCDENEQHAFVLALTWLLGEVKVAYLAHTPGTVTVWNLDQTGLQVLPSARRGWCKPGTERVRFVCDDKRMVTLLVATPMEGGELVGQIIWDGKTARTLPADASPANVTCMFSECHWSTLETTVEFFLTAVCRLLTVTVAGCITGLRCLIALLCIETRLS